MLYLHSWTVLNANWNVLMYKSAPRSSPMKLLTLAAILAYALCAVCTTAGAAGQRAARFSAVQSASRTQCSPLPPLVTFRARSRLDCSDQCVGDGSCVAFNFREAKSGCELFSNLTNNYTEVPGCTLYQVSFVCMELLIVILLHILIEALGQ